MTPNENWFIIDSTKAKCYLECPRKFWWEHILGWRQSGSNLNLVFGEAFHKVLERMLLEGFDVATIERGMEDFNDIYRKTFSAFDDADRAPKNAAFAEMAALGYANNYREDLLRYEVLHTEVSGSVMVVPPSDDRKINRIHFKIDSILKDLELDSIVILEHKTTGQSFTQRYANQWPLSFQIGTYSHAVRAFYPPEQVWGVIVNAISLLKTKINFQRFPVRKTTPQMEVWRQIADKVLWDIEQDLNSYIAEANDPDYVMESFPMNPVSCDRWFGCPYLDFCISWENPIVRTADFTTPPEGFMVEFWDPRKIETREKMEL